MIDNDADYQSVLALDSRGAARPKPIPVDFGVQTIALVTASLPCSSYQLFIDSVRETEVDIEVNYRVRSLHPSCFTMVFATGRMVLFDNVRRLPVRMIAR